jgi:pimeloyl-ACP methyl ester carboxylesterase
MRTMFFGPWKVRAWEWYYGTLFPTREPADFDAFRAALRANLAEPGRFDAVKAMLFRSDAAIEALLTQVSAPSLVLMGSKDPDWPDPAAEATWIAQQLRGTAEMIEGAGHYPQAEMPEITASLILDFLARHKRAA